MPGTIAEPRASAISIHANAFADHLQTHRELIHEVLRKYQSYEVVEDEIERSVEALQHMGELEEYYSGTIDRIAVFLPLNLPLYSFVLFVAMPSYQTHALVVRPPERMASVFQELFTSLSLGNYYDNVTVFSGGRQDFADLHCVPADVVIFTGKYENFLNVRKVCGKQKLILFNGAGHNPIVVTETADIDRAVEKTLHVKLFNNGQDCAGPDAILVHQLVVDEFLTRLVERLGQVRIGCDYSEEDTRIGPLFERSSIDRFTERLRSVMDTGGSLVTGGVVDFGTSVVHPCVCRHTLQQYVNHQELYSPLFIVTEYASDADLKRYFDDVHGRYAERQMYISVFGRSRYVDLELPGSIPLMNISIHDAERGSEEFGGYGIGASAVSFGKLLIPKPILVPREIHTYLFSSYGPKIRAAKGAENQVIESMFSEVVTTIFQDDLVFAYIFGSYAMNRAKSYSDVDTFVCLKKRDPKKVRAYLEWLFEMSEVFGKIPDFKYPAEIVELAELERAVERFKNLSLIATTNTADEYDAMLWVHSLSHYKTAVVNSDAIPDEWVDLFTTHSGRIVKGFLEDLRRRMVRGEQPENHLYFGDIPTDSEGVDQYIRNLGNGRKLVGLLRYISFKDRMLYAADVLDLIGKRRFFGRKHFMNHRDSFAFEPSFRYGVTRS